VDVSECKRLGTVATINAGMLASRFDSSIKDRGRVCPCDRRRRVGMSCQDSARLLISNPFGRPRFSYPTSSESVGAGKLGTVEAGI
jgi:hypothetical protein